MSASPWIIEANVTNFAKDVIERSNEVPVVVDFWAPWCGPCKSLGPILERFAVELDGAFVLAKVDTDQNPELAQVFRVQGIPTVVAIDKGRPVDGFSGALPPAEVKAFLERVAPKKAASQLERALELEAAGDRAEAIEVLRSHLRQKSGDDEARVQLARMLLDDGRAAEARKVFDRLGEEALASDAARSVKAALELVENAGDLGELEAKVAADPADHGARIELGKTLVSAGRPEEGLEHLLEVVRRDRGFEDDAARKAMIEVFEALGDEHPATAEYRRELQMLLLV